MAENKTCNTAINDQKVESKTTQRARIALVKSKSMDKTGKSQTVDKGGPKLPGTYRERSLRRQRLRPESSNTETKIGGSKE